MRVVCWWLKATKSHSIKDVWITEHSGEYRGEHTHKRLGCMGMDDYGDLVLMTGFGNE